jgi:hypothetical protein
MAVTTKILSDTKTHAKVLLTWNADAAATAAAVDATNASSGFALLTLQKQDMGENS